MIRYIRNGHILNSLKSQLSLNIFEVHFFCSIYAPYFLYRFSSSRSSSVSTLSLDVGHNHESEWYDILVKFDWKSVVAKYVLRDVTMEDHLREYIFSLASFLEHTQV